MLRRLDLRGIDGDLAAKLPRPNVSIDAPTNAVRNLLDEIETRGDAAVRELTARFDGAEIDDLRVPRLEIEAAVGRVDPELLDALRVAHKRILDFHRHEAADAHTVESDGIAVTSLPRPVERAGVYVPGGLAAYPSTVLMTVLPARAAGVEDIVVCTPPGSDGTVLDVVLAAAQLCGVTEVLRVGGVQAIGAMAYGTETIRAVDVIAGPGNIWVATAKQEVAGRVGIASAFAGPSEIVVVADSTTPATSAAVDVVLQAEHGPGGRAWLVTWDEAHADAVERAIGEIVAISPRRDETMATLEADGWICLVDGPDAALAVSDGVAPEHLQLMCADAGAMAQRVRHAGAVFVGPWGPASIGDYVAGPSHVLPTAGTARFSGALTVDDFQKRMHIVDVSKRGFDEVGTAAVTLAEAEGLWAHAASVSKRESWARDGVS
ncbi:MAG: histidinol dehydrogenase [Actinomycetia bacterium]|nr:histidinol dehydrogenase [Actinomycetes bacterium]